MSKPVLLLVMSKRCGGCIQYKATVLPKIKGKLEKDNRFTFKLIELEDFNTANYKNFPHPGIPAYINFFPTYVLFTGESFNDPNSKLVGVVNNSAPEGENPMPEHSEAGLEKWISNTLSKAPFLKGASSNKPLHKVLPGGQMIVPTRGTYSKFRTDGDMYL